MNTKILATAAVATTLLGLAAPAHSAALKFGTDGIQFNKDTTVNFTFLSSRGHAITSIGVFDANRNLLTTLFEEKGVSNPEYYSDAPNGVAEDSWLGTAANLKGSAQVSFTFLANQIYSLGVFGTDWGQTLTPVYSTTGLNASGTQQAVFNSTGGIEKQELATASSLTDAKQLLNNKSSVAIAFEDLLPGNSWYDKDYNDVVIQADVPEPLTMTGLALGISGLVAARRRRHQKNA